LKGYSGSVILPNVLALNKINYVSSMCPGLKTIELYFPIGEDNVNAISSGHLQRILNTNLHEV
jgi:hypothetical protein